MSERLRAADPVRAVEALLGVPATRGNHVQVLQNGEEIFPAMLEAIADARRTVDLLTYAWWTGEITEQVAEALAERARAGVRVRVVVDAIGGWAMPDEQAELLSEAGVEFRRFRPMDEPKMWRNSHRTHRRALVVDGVIGMTGGVGIAQEWTGDGRTPGSWRETHLRLRGSVVDGLRAAFLEIWAECDDAVVDDADDVPDHAADGEVTAIVVRSSAGHGIATMSLLKRMLVEMAHERIRITTAYFSPDEGSRDALQAALERGVQVQLLVPGDHIDKRVSALAAADEFEWLLERGGEVHLFDATMLHAKTLTVDGHIADVGSANFNSRSLSQDEELDVILFDGGVAATLDEHFDADLRHAEQIDPDRWRERGWTQRLAETTVGLVDEVL